VNTHIAVILALLAVAVLAYLTPTDDPSEIIWTSLGAGGAVYAWHVWRRRRAADQWRKQQGMNGLFGLTTQTHAILRGLGFLGQILILISGVGAMLNWSRLVIIGLIIALAAVATFSCWFAERMAEKQTDYYLKHPADGGPLSLVAQADHEAVVATEVAADAADDAAEKVRRAVDLHKDGAP
jgi:hypothetical protein